MNKVKAERLHAKRRAQERYGLSLTKDIRNTLKSKIKNGDGKFLCRQSRRVTVWEIAYEGVSYKVVYDKLRGEIVTFLPHEEKEEENCPNPMENSPKERLD